MKKNSRRYGFWALLSCGVLGATFGAATSGLAQSPFAGNDGGSARRLLSRDAKPMEIPELANESSERLLDASRQPLASLTQQTASTQDDRRASPSWAPRNAPPPSSTLSATRASSTCRRPSR